MTVRSFRDTPFADAFRWTPAGAVDGRALAIAALGMTAPALVGLAVGRAEVGFTIGLGAMLLADGPSAPGAAAAERPSAGSAILPAALAVAAATAISGLPGTDLAMIALAGAAALASGYSRPVAVAAIRFIVYLVLSWSLLENAGAHRGGAALIFGLGALWNVAVRMMLARPAAAATEPPAQRRPTAAQLRARWRRTLRELAGWQFAIRVVAGLGAATLLRHLWPDRHYGWIVLTVALLTQRPIEHLPVKTIQRAIGVTLGVGATWAILVAAPPPLLLGALICLLATAAAIARPRNYLAYAVVSTPVILLVMDLGKPVETTLLTDRLVATVVGAAIVVAANVALDRAMARAAPPPPQPSARP